MGNNGMTIPKPTRSMKTLKKMISNDGFLIPSLSVGPNAKAGARKLRIKSYPLLSASAWEAQECASGWETPSTWSS
jgi:hypothetical protein